MSKDETVTIRFHRDNGAEQTVQEYEARLVSTADQGRAPSMASPTPAELRAKAILDAKTMDALADLEAGGPVVGKVYGGLQAGAWFDGVRRWAYRGQLCDHWSADDDGNYGADDADIAKPSEDWLCLGDHATAEAAIAEYKAAQTMTFDGLSTTPAEPYPWVQVPTLADVPWGVELDADTARGFINAGLRLVRQVRLGSNASPRDVFFDDELLTEDSTSRFVGYQDKDGRIQPPPAEPTRPKWGEAMQVPASDWYARLCTANGAVSFVKTPAPADFSYVYAPITMPEPYEPPAVPDGPGLWKAADGSMWWRSPDGNMDERQGPTGEYYNVGNGTVRGCKAVDVVALIAPWTKINP